MLKELWGLADIPPQRPDVIVPLGYATLHNKLTDASRELFKGALQTSKWYPDAAIAFGNSSHCFPGSEKVESCGKRTLARMHDVDERRLVDAGGITNTVVEARAIKKALEERGIAPKEILIITGKFHSRGAYFVWRRTFPHAHIALYGMDVAEYQPNHVFAFQRGKWQWFAANVLRQLALRIMGLDWVSRVKHTGNF